MDHGEATEPPHSPLPAGLAWNPLPDSSLVDRARALARSRPSASAYTWLEDGEVEERALSFAELDRSARAVAAELAARGLGGQRVLADVLARPAVHHGLPRVPLRRRGGRAAEPAAHGARGARAGGHHRPRGPVALALRSIRAREALGAPAGPRRAAGARDRRARTRARGPLAPRCHRSGVDRLPAVHLRLDGLAQGGRDHARQPGREPGHDPHGVRARRAHGDRRLAAVLPRHGPDRRTSWSRCSSAGAAC